MRGGRRRRFGISRTFLSTPVGSISFTATPRITCRLRGCCGGGVLFRVGDGEG